MKKLTLLVSDDKRSHNIVGKKLLLGKWCINNKSYNDHEYQIVKPYGLLIENKIRDFEKVKIHEKKILGFLPKILNETHDLNLPVNIWKIIIGHWLRTFITVTLNRLSVLLKAIEEHKIDEVSLIKYNNSLVIQKTAFNSQLNYDNSITDNFIYENIFNNRNFNCFTKKVVNDNSTKEDIEEKFYYDPKKKVNFKIFGIVNKLFSKIYNNNDPFIISSYLTYKNEIILNMLLGNFPKLWQKHNLEFPGNVDLELRSKLEDRISSLNMNIEEEIIFHLIFKLIPTCYLEDFNFLKDYVDKIKWPQNPLFIYTANNFYFDEVFKLWAALKKNDGIKYIIGQHGNNYGNSYKSPSLEEELSDKFITWGWNNQNKKYVRGFIFKDINFKRNTNSRDIIFQTIHYLPRIQTYDEFYEYYQQKKEVYSLTDKIEKDLKKNILIRLHSASEIFRKDDYSEWKKYNPNIRIDRGRGYTNQSKLYKNARAIVHCYDSTGILETLSANIPTFAYFQNLEHLNFETRNDYKELVNAEILHFSSNSLARKINEVYENIEEWWNEGARQKTLNFFVSKYANNRNKTLKNLVRILKQ